MMLMTNHFRTEVIPLEFHLMQNFPNPFRGKTTIKYCVPYRTKVIITVIDSEGNIVEKLISKETNAGFYEVEFNAKNLLGGTYFYQLIAGKYSQTLCMDLMK